MATLFGQPLDLMEVSLPGKNGSISRVPAINVGFMEIRVYLKFHAPPPSEIGHTGLSAEEEQWLELAKFIKEDFEWILHLTYHKFWSQVVHDSNLHVCLVTFLTRAPRAYDRLFMNVKEELVNSLNELHKLVFLIYLRMSSYKESNVNHMQTKYFGNTIYDSNIFDIPKILDLCALYARENLPLLSKMVQSIFSNQPKFELDLKESMDSILNVFNHIEERVPVIPFHVSKIAVSDFPIPLICDIVSSSIDFTFTLNAFIEVYPPVCQLLYQNGTTRRLSTFYEHVYLILEKGICQHMSQPENKKKIEEAKLLIGLSKTLTIKIFRSILDYCCLQHMYSEKIRDENKSSRNAHCESFLEIISEMTEKQFLKDYNAMYPFDKDLELFAEIGIHLDPESINYVFCVIHDSPELMQNQDFKGFQSSAANGAKPKVRKVPEVQSFQAIAAVLNDNQSSGESEDEEIKEYEKLSLIHAVIDVFPELGDGFVEKCLEYYSFDASKVIDAILKPPLPDALNDLDKNLKRIPVIKEETSLLSERKNIFDYDEFDVFRRNDVNMDNIHIGKKNKIPSTYEPLGNFLKEKILEYELQEDSYRVDLYDDEYDDTYDSTEVGLKERCAEDLPEKEEEKQDNEQQNERQRRPEDFCMNPEVLRAQAAQRYESRAAARGNRRGGGQASNPSSSQNRQNKDRHKAHVANHNRRSQSDFKRSRGMYPS